MLCRQTVRMQNKRSQIKDRPCLGLSPLACSSAALIDVSQPGADAYRWVVHTTTLEFYDSTCMSIDNDFLKPTSLYVGSRDMMSTSTSRCIADQPMPDADLQPFTPILPLKLRAYSFYIAKNEANARFTRLA